MLLVCDIDRIPVMDPTTTPAPARPKPPNISTFEPPDLCVSPCSGGVSTVVAAPPVVATTAAAPAGSSTVSCF
jgi:hypothetical protein